MLCLSALVGTHSALPIQPGQLSAADDTKATMCCPRLTAFIMDVVSSHESVTLYSVAASGKDQERN